MPDPIFEVINRNLLSDHNHWLLLFFYYFWFFRWFPQRLLFFLIFWFIFCFNNFLQWLFNRLFFFDDFSFFCLFFWSLMCLRFCRYWIRRLFFRFSVFCFFYLMSLSFRKTASWRGSSLGFSWLDLMDKCLCLLTYFFLSATKTGRAVSMALFHLKLMFLMTLHLSIFINDTFVKAIFQVASQGHNRILILTIYGYIRSFWAFWLDQDFWQWVLFGFLWEDF